ncbi:MAG: nitroreductase family protein [Clostridia bacterium]|nr:nitroreductase family protein [Clostridia bacterium]
MRVIFERTSVRDFDWIEVPNSHVDYLIKTAMNAPNSGHQRPWEFIVVRDRKVMDELTKMHGYENNYGIVDVAIVVCINQERIKWDGYWQMNTGTAVENMMLSATDLGYATLWLEIFPVERKVNEARAILNLPDHVIPMMMMPIGEAVHDERREPCFLKDQIHYNQW